MTKTLAQFLFDDENAVVRLDMSEYMEKHSVSRLIGAPPGYVGYEEGGQLTERVRRRPYAVVLFDEIEKAHPDVFHILLQLLEDGRLTDGQGRAVNFKNTVVIMTSNIGSRFYREKEKSYEEIRELVLQELTQHFRPELLNRIDETIVFQPLTRDHIQKIVSLQLDQLKAKLYEQRRIALKFTERAVNILAVRGYDPDFGVRPLRRLIQREIQDPLALRLLRSEFRDPDTVNVDWDAKAEVFSFTKNLVAEKAANR